MNGKGSARRPKFVSDDTFAMNYERSFTTQSNLSGLLREHYHSPVTFVAHFEDWRRSRHLPVWEATREGWMYPVSGQMVNMAPSMRGIVSISQLPRPRGWRWERQLGRDVWLLMPAWLYYMRLVRFRWHGWVFGPLLGIGFWRLPEEGGYYVDGRFTWDWWRSLEWRRSIPQGTFSYRIGRRYYAPAGWWERMGWWVQQRIIDRWRAEMPVW